MAVLASADGETVQYHYGPKDLVTVLFYIFIAIILHAVVQEYILDVSARSGLGGGRLRGRAGGAAAARRPRSSPFAGSGSLGADLPYHTVSPPSTPSLLVVVFIHGRELPEVCRHGVIGLTRHGSGMSPSHLG